MWLIPALSRENAGNWRNSVFFSTKCRAAYRIVLSLRSFVGLSSIEIRVGVCEGSTSFASSLDLARLVPGHFFAWRRLKRLRDQLVGRLSAVELSGV
ncbi:hypothetical protein ACVI1L_000502 [Bradyrhizobium sp. USDA 4516]